MERCPPKPSKPPSAANLNPLSRDEAKGQSRLSARPQKGGHPKAHSAPSEPRAAAQSRADCRDHHAEARGMRHRELNRRHRTMRSNGTGAEYRSRPCLSRPVNTRRKNAAGGERWVDSVQGINGYKGLIDLARRSGQIVSIAAHEVCEHDTFECIYGLNETLTHIPSMAERGEVIAFYAVAKLKDGGHAFEVMSRRQ